jgi:hypothetical protein
VPEEARSAPAGAESQPQEEPMLTDIATVQFALGSLTQDSADTAIRLLAEEMRRITARGIQCMLLLGQVLLEIQDRELWRGRWAKWGDFLREGVPSYTGLSARTAYDAMDLARSPALNHLPADQVNAIASVGNAKRVARLERTGEPITTEIIEMSQTMQTEEFHRATGASRGTKVQVWLQDPAAAAAMQRLVDALAGAGALALDALTEVLTSDAMVGYAGGARENRIDAVIGAVVAATVQELEVAGHAEPAVVSQDLHDLESAPIPHQEVLAYERQTGLEIQVFPGRQQPFVAYGYENGDIASTGHPAAYGSGATVDVALAELRDARLRAVVLQVIQGQGFRCAMCDRAVSLQGHHKTFRSHGGTDERSNIEAVCAGCHHKKHGRKLPKAAVDFEEEVIIDCFHNFQEGPANPARSSQL